MKYIFTQVNYFLFSLAFIHLFCGILFAQIHLTIPEPLKNLGDTINTSSNEFAPALSPDASFMIFNSRRNQKYQNLYITYFNFEKGNWGKPLPMNKVNSRYNDETPSLSNDGQTLFFSSDRDGSFEMPKNKQGKIKVSFDIYFSQNTQQGWSRPQKTPGKINTIHHEKAPSVSHDNQSLFYTMWRFGDIKNTVIMRAQLINGMFLNPKPLPKPINEGYQELALIESINGNGFYFSSLRPGGLGGWDIYYVSVKQGLFGKAINLGNKVNSKKNDAFLSRVDQLFFISSDRKGGKGRFDIYSTFIFENRESFKTRIIYFDFNSAKIKKRSNNYLNALTHFLKNNPKLKLDIVGHTDLHGSDEFNVRLSRNRSKAVKHYLVKKGIDKHRLNTKGLGKQQPFINKIGDNFDRQNRRIEFFIQSNKKTKE